MFARIAGSTGCSSWDRNHDATSAQDCNPANGNAWIWTEQSFLAQRRAFNCPPFEAPPNLIGRSRQALICRSLKGKRSSFQPALRRPPKHSGLCSAPPAGVRPHQAAPPSKRAADAAGAPSISRTRAATATVTATASCTPVASPNSPPPHSRGPPQRPEDTLDSAPTDTTTTTTTSSSNGGSSITNSSSSDKGDSCALPSSSSSSRGDSRTTTSSSSSSTGISDPISLQLQATTSFRELQLLVTALLPTSSFSSRHASLAIQRLPLVSSPQGCDGQLLLVEQLVGRLGPGVAYLAPTDIAALAWALAKVGYECDPLLLQQAVGAFFAKMKQEWAPAAALVTLAVGLAGLGFRDPPTWRRLLAAASKLLPSLSAEGLQQLAWACATARQQEEGFCRQLAEACLEQLDAFKIEELVTLVWCLESLGHQDQALLQAVAEKMVLQVEGRARPPPGTSSSSSSSSSPLQGHPCAGWDSTSSSSRPDECEQYEGRGGQFQEHAQDQQKQHGLSRLSGRGCCSPGDLGSEGWARWQSPAGGHLGVHRAYDTLGRYDPFLCIMVLYRDFFGGGQVADKALQA